MLFDQGVRTLFFSVFSVFFFFSFFFSSLSLFLTVVGYFSLCQLTYRCFSETSACLCARCVFCDDTQVRSQLCSVRQVK